MSGNNLDWNNFWKVRARDPLDFIDEPRYWSDVCWKVGLEEWFDRIQKYAPGKKILECGCGSAVFSRYMALRGFECTLVDSSENAISLALEWFREKNIHVVSYVGDMNSLPFEDSEFDVVYSGGVLEFFPNIEKPISEKIRVLKKNGFFSANIVPRKFSIQTIADIQRTIAHGLICLAQGKFRDLKLVRMVPMNYSVNNFSLSHFVEVLQRTGLNNVVGRVSTPYPSLALPSILMDAYTKFLIKQIPQWKEFNCKSDTNILKQLQGITYTLYGSKV